MAKPTAGPGKTDPALLAKLDQIHQTLLTLVSQQQVAFQATEQLRSEVFMDFTRLQAAVQKETDGNTAVKTLITGLGAMIADLKTKMVNPADQAAVDSFADQVAANVDDLATATIAGTPAEA